MKKTLGRVVSAAALAAAGALVAQAASAEDGTIKIGYALSLSGINAQGAGTTTSSPGFKVASSAL